MMRMCKWCLIPLLMFACDDASQLQPAQGNIALSLGSNRTSNVVGNLTTSEKIYYLAGYPGDLYRINGDGTGDTKLTSDRKNGNLDVSADGTKIVFANVAKNNWNLYIADVNTAGLANKRILFAGKYHDEDCKFSKDGTKVVFKTNQFAIAQFGNSRAYDICVINVATGVVTKLTNNSNVEAWAPCFSPDGSQIAFVSRPNSQGAEGDEIYLINSDGSNLKRITNNSFSDWYPTFSANGNLIYASQKVVSCDDDLYQIAASALTTADPGSQAVALTINACNLVSDADPYASKINEAQVVFVSTRNGGYGIYSGDKSTGAVTMIASKSGTDLLGPVLVQ